MHNLLLLVEKRLKDDGIENEAELERKAKELAKASEIAAKAGRKMPSAVATLQRLTQRSVKLLRCSGPASWIVLPGTPPRLAYASFIPLFNSECWTPFQRITRDR